MYVPRKAGGYINCSNQHDPNSGMKETSLILLPANHLLIMGEPLLIMESPMEGHGHEEGIQKVSLHVHGHQYMYDHTWNPTRNHTHI